VPEGGPRRLSRERRSVFRPTPGTAARDGAGAAAEEREPARAALPASVPRADNPAARAAAERWFNALSKGDADSMADLAAYPFRTTGGAVVKSRDQLMAMLRDLTAESHARGAGSLQIFTAAGARSGIGKLPPGLDDGSGSLFAISAVSDHDAIVLVLAQRTGVWKTVGLFRR
jgi:hypothetical protein